MPQRIQVILMLNNVGLIFQSGGTEHNYLSLLAKADAPRKQLSPWSFWECFIPTLFLVCTMHYNQ